MMHTLTTDPTHAADLDTVAQLLTPTGDRVSDPRLDRWADELDAAALRALYRDMAITRRLDGEGVALQRQGHLGLWAPAQGQEAIQVASAHACRPDDFLFPSYRELGVLVTRGASPADLVLGWRGEVHGTFDPYALHVAVLHEGFVTSVSNDVRRFAPQIAQPTLLIAAEKDDITPIEAERHLQTLFPDAELVEIPGVGHLIHYETPQQAASAITRFLRPSGADTR